MTAEELPNPPRKASWKRWIVVLAGVLAVVLAVLLLKAPGPELVSVRFVGSTSEYAQKTVAFKGTNGLSKTISYQAWISLRVPEATLTNGVIYSSIGGASGTAGPRETFTFEVHAPENERDWIVLWYFGDAAHATTRFERAREACYWFFTKHRMHTLAQHFRNDPRWHYIRASEVKE